ncbi:MULTISPECIES: porin family protein [Flavobacterium]|uniref:porin family protein n=1 Tax=Flavobacterium TaxID=237 RepID=UPI0021140561|nr:MULTISPECIES: porin family protein [Flavobacterium]UUF12415.1 PorT family protein [Flavobacterium panici]
MKIIFLIIALLVGITTTVNAQDNTIPKSNAGIKLGYNLAAVSFDGDGESGQRHGFHIGIYGEFFVSESFSIQPEILYSQQGNKITNSGGTFTQKLDYINLPLMFKAYPSKNFFLEMGRKLGWQFPIKKNMTGFLILHNNMTLTVLIGV